MRAVQVPARPSRDVPGFPAPEAVTIACSPWQIFRARARSIGIAFATCLVVLLTLELAIFRSGFFASHVRFFNPIFPTEKLALAARSTDARLLYVGDSMILSDVAPAIVSAVCQCGPGFNGAFAGANPRLTDAMTRRLLSLMHPQLVVVGLSPWVVGDNARYDAGDFAREIIPPVDLYELGTPVDAIGTVDKALGRVWSAYGQRNLIKEWLASLVPGQQYDEALRGLRVPPGSASSPVQLAEAANTAFGGLKQPKSSAPGAIATGSLISELRTRGIAVAILVPPLHPAAHRQAGPYLDRADAAIRELALEHAVPVIDCRSAVSSDDFRDLTHLLYSGAVKHSTCVGDQIRTLLATDHAVQ